jgi:hypothetical protein
MGAPSPLKASGEPGFDAMTKSAQLLAVSRCSSARHAAGPVPNSAANQRVNGPIEAVAAGMSLLQLYGSAAATRSLVNALSILFP